MRTGFKAPTPSPRAGALAPASAALAALVLLGGCAAGPASRALVLGPGSGPRIELNLVPGAHYEARRGFGPFGYKVQPQVAVWLESPEGRYLGTLFVTDRAERGAWRAAPERGRPEALPVWSRLRGAEADAVSAATAKGETRVAARPAAGMPSGPCVVMLETNRSYDWNEAYPEAAAGVNGQPSLVYRAAIDAAGPARVADFELLGRGSVDGSDGEIRPGAEGITTALELFSSMKAAWLPD